jgi:phage terminase large subunit
MGFAQMAIVRAYSSKVRIVCAREILNSIRESVHSELCYAVEALGLSDYFECGSTYIKCKTTGSEIMYAGLYRNLDNLKGLGQIDICWIDEAESVSEASYTKLIPSIRADKSEIWATWNPERIDSATRNRFIINPPQSIAITQINWRDNPWFPAVLEEERIELESRDKDAYLHVWEGQCTTRSDAQIMAGRWEIKEFDTTEWTEKPMFGADWGFSIDPTTLTKSYVKSQCLWIDHEAYGRHVELMDLPAMFDTVPESRRHTIYADNARPETISYMQGAGFKIVACDKWKGSVEDGIAHLRGAYDMIYVHPRCVNTISELSMYSYKIDKHTEKPTSDIIDDHNHCIDALRYSVGNRIQRKNVKPVVKASVIPTKHHWN